MDPERLERIVLTLGSLDGCWLAFRPAELVMSLGYLPCWGVSLCLWAPDGSRTLYIPELEPGDRLPKDVRCRRFPWGVLTCSDPWTVLLGMIRADADQLGLTGRPLFWRSRNQQSAHPSMCGETPPMDETFPERLAAEVFKKGHDANEELNRLFLLKTPKEVERIRHANEIAAKGVDAFHAGLEAGVSEAELAGRVESAVMAQMKRDDVSHARAWAMVQSGSESLRGGTYSRTTGRVMRTGDAVFMELATCVDGFYSDLTRVGTVGQGSRKWDETLALVREAQRRAIETIKPGVACGDVDMAARSFLDEQGLGATFTHLTGHQVGFHYHDPGPVLAPGSDAALEAGMIVTVEPGVYLAEAGFGIRVEDNLLVTESGAQSLSAGVSGGYAKEER